MTPDELLALYDQQLRAEAEVGDADEVTRIGPVFAATFARRGRGFVTYQSIPQGTDVPALIDEVVAHYVADQRVDHFEWKTRGHDAIPNLLDLLVERGFELDEVETIMAGDIEAVIAAAEPVPAGYTVQQATSEQAIREAEELAGRVFGDGPARIQAQGDELIARRRSAPGSFEMWLVRGPDGAIVCSGRIDFVDGTQFAGLWGGACDEAQRGKGLYRAITAERAKSAKARGKKYLQSDCTRYSRPILERAGLVAITTSTPAVWKRSTSAPVE